MIDIKENFKFKYNGDLLCEFCKSDAETSTHLLQFKVLLPDPNIGELFENIEPNDIYKYDKHQLNSWAVYYMDANTHICIEIIENQGTKS